MWAHLLLSSLPSALELVMNFVGFLAGTNFVLEVPRFKTKHALISFHYINAR